MNVMVDPSTATSVTIPSSAAANVTSVFPVNRSPGGAVTVTGSPKPGVVVLNVAASSVGVTRTGTVIDCPPASTWKLNSPIVLPAVTWYRTRVGEVGGTRTPSEL